MPLPRKFAVSNHWGITPQAQRLISDVASAGRLMGATREVRAYVLAVVKVCTAVVGLGMGCGGAHADTLEWALVQAYQNNPSLSAQ